MIARFFHRAIGRIVIPAFLMIALTGCSQAEPKQPAIPACLSVSGTGHIASLTCLTETPQALAKVELEAQIAPPDGNVYDDDDISVTLRAIGPDGQALSVIGFYYVPYATFLDYQINYNAGEPSWRFRFSPPCAGWWEAAVTVDYANGVSETLSGIRFQVAEPSDSRGFLSVEPNHRQTFCFENGDDFVVIGQNIAWSTGNPSNYYAELFKKLSQSGGNFARIWLTQWDLALQTAGCRPDDLSGGMYRAAQLDTILQSAEQYGIYVELCVFHHGQFSTNANPVWDGCCYNSSFPTGYLSHPSEFFRNERALEDTRDYLRYIVARWGYSTHIMSWQLFNEADLTEHGLRPLYQWHQDMCDYIRSIDWQGHMVTTSTAGRFGVSSLPCFDYVCGHWYSYETADKLCQVQTTGHTQHQKPYLFDEAGNGQLDGNLISIRQQNWAGLMGGGGGVAVNWYWQQSDRIDGYYQTFRPVADFAARIPWSDPQRQIHPLSSLSGNHPQVGAVGYSGPRYAYLWLFDLEFSNTNRTETVFEGYQVTVSLSSGAYSVQWIDPQTGETVQTDTATAANGSLTLKAPTFSRDLLVAAEPCV